jgi:single-strand DNA-binding protein
MALEIAGKLHGKSEIQQITDKFKKREFILELNDNGYTQFVKFQLNQDKCNIIDNFVTGEQIKVSFNLTGRQYTKKTGETDYITNIVAWRIEKMNSADGNDDMNTNNKVFELRNSEGEEDILPF